MTTILIKKNGKTRMHDKKICLKFAIYLSLLIQFLAFQANATSLERKFSAANVKTEQGISSLGWLIINRDTSKALALIKNGVDLRAYQSEVTIKKIVTPNVNTTYIGDIDLQAYPLVILAAASGQDAIVKAMHKKDENAVKLKDFHDNDALMWAAREGHVSTVALLLSYGLNPLYLSQKSKTSAFELSLEKEKYQVIDVIVNHLIHKKQTAQLSKVIWYLSGSDQTELLRKYLRLGIKDTYRATKPTTSLMKAADWGKLENFKLLVQYGSDPYESNSGPFDYNYDPLTYAINNEDFLAYLLDNYDYNLKKVFDGQNYLHLAYTRHNRPRKELFLMLLKKSGLNINSVDSDGNTLLDKAVANADTEYVRFFLSLDLSDQSVNKGLKSALEYLEGYEREYRRAENNYDLAKIQSLNIICQILHEKINQGGD